MAQTLKPEQFNRIIKLVSPCMSSENRRTYITAWCMNHEALYGRIQWTGADRAFTNHVVELFLKHGQIEPNKSALQAFLESVREDMGQEDQVEIDNILSEVQPSGNNIGNNSTPKPLPPQSQRATHFTGRETILAELCQSLQPGKMVALCGPGGIGKTALALEAVYSLHDDNQLDQRFPDGVLFHSFYDEQETDLALDNLLRQLGEQVQPPLQQQAQRILAQRQLLIILDGAEDATDLPVVLSVRGNSGVLITSRERQDARGCTRLDVEPMPDTDAVDLLLQLVDSNSCDQKTAQAICQRVGNLPLAVQLVGRDMAQNGLLGQEFLQWLQQTPLEVLDQGKRRQESIPILLDRSLAGISEAARNALALIGQLALAPVDSTLLAPALEQLPEQMPRLLGELVNLSLLRREADGRYGVVHALIHTYASAQMKPPSDSLEQLGQAYTHFAKHQSGLGLEGYGCLDPERVHLLAVTQACADAELWSVVDELVGAAHEYLHTQGHWRQRIRLLQLGVQSAQKLQNRWKESNQLGNLGSAYNNLGRVPEAIGYYEQALIISQEIGDRKGEGNRLGSIGGAYRALGRVTEAIDYYKQAQTIAQELGNFRNEGANLCSLGLAYSNLGRMEEAIDCYEQALNIVQESGDRRGKGTILGNTGLAYDALGRVTEAIAYYGQALTIAQEFGSRRGEGAHLGNLGRANALLGYGVQAIELSRQSLKIHREISNRIHEGYALNYLGYAYGIAGEWDKAIKHHQQALSILEEVGDRRQIGLTWNDLGEAYVATDQFTEAESAFDQALALAQEVGDRWGEAQCQWNRGLLYERQGKMAEAVAAMQVCVDYFQEIGHVDADERAARLAALVGGC